MDMWIIIKVLGVGNSIQGEYIVWKKKWSRDKDQKPQHLRSR